jgi:hypothetical protein
MEAFLSDKTYRVIKWAVVIVLPAIGTLYFGLAEIWGLPAAQQVLGTIVALQAFLGVVLGLSSRSYNASDAQYAGAINMSHTPTGLLYSLDLAGDPEDIQHQDKVTFKVNAPSST